MATAVVSSVSEEQIQTIQTGRNRLLERAKSLVVNSVENYQTACEIVKGIAELRKMIEADFKPAKSSAYDTWKAICAQEKNHLDGLSEPDRIVRSKISDYNVEQERIRREEERKAREVAERQAEERKIQEAIKAEAQGRPELANTILDTPVVAAPIVVPKATVPKVEGVSMATTWKFEITDSSLIPREYLTVDETKIRKVVQALKEQSSIPGVRVYSTQEPRVGGSRY
jgi:hypothetical protein